MRPEQTWRRIQVVHKVRNTPAGQSRSVQLEGKPAPWGPGGGKLVPAVATSCVYSWARASPFLPPVATHGPLNFHRPILLCHSNPVWIPVSPLELLSHPPTRCEDDRLQSPYAAAGIGACTCFRLLCGPPRHFCIAAPYRYGKKIAEPNGTETALWQIQLRSIDHSPRIRRSTDQPRRANFSLDVRCHI